MFFLLMSLSIVCFSTICFVDDMFFEFFFSMVCFFGHMFFWPYIFYIKCMFYGHIYFRAYSFWIICFMWNSFVFLDCDTFKMLYIGVVFVCFVRFQQTSFVLSAFLFVCIMYTVCYFSNLLFYFMQTSEKEEKFCITTWLFIYVHCIYVHNAFELKDQQHERQYRTASVVQ